MSFLGKASCDASEGNIHLCANARGHTFHLGFFICCFFRSIQPEDKSFAVGIQFMLLRVLGKLKRVEMPSWKTKAASGDLWGFQP